jgi:hypothetical protein
MQIHSSFPSPTRIPSPLKKFVFSVPLSSPPFPEGEWGEGILGGGIGGKIRGKMICRLGRRERTFQVRHFKACPVAIEDGPPP